MFELELKKTYGLFAGPSNRKLIADLENGGGQVLVFPSFIPERLELSTAAAGFLSELDAFEWLVLTDVYAADFFIEYLSELEIDLFELDNLTICALGEAVADRLRFVQVHADVIPSNISDESVFALISNYAGASGLNGRKFLAVCEKHAESRFIGQLVKARAAVETIPIYQAQFEDEPARTKLKTLLAGGAVDELVFSTPEDLLKLKSLVPGADLSALLKDTRVSAVSEVVFQTLQENGLRPLYFHAQ